MTDNMKIRTDFVTNSSSSSFILAIKKDVTDDQINKYIEDIIPEIKKYAKEYSKYENDTTVQKVAEEIKDGVKKVLLNGNKYNTITLSDWNISSMTVGNEDDAPYAFLYDIGIPDSDFIKTGSGD